MPYTLQQQTFVLSILSNCASLEKGTAAKLAAWLKNDVTQRLAKPLYRDLLGDWELVWGPVIWELHLTQLLGRADNAMMAVQNRDTKDIVVAIAGTNMNSIFDAVEDLNVDDVVPFAGADGAWISKGTADGLKQLEKMQDPDTEQTLFAFLSGLPATNAKLIFTGHSLGGALSPAIALDYVVNQNLPVANFSNVYVYPSAGPSVGNPPYVGLFEQTFPAVNGEGYNVWNLNVRNDLDSIPRVWAEIDTLPSLYPPLNNGKPIPCVQKLAQKALLPATKGQPYTDLPYSMFSRPFDPKVKAPLKGTTCAWFAQVCEQHIDQYYRELAPELRDDLPVLLTPSKGICTALDVWCLAQRLL